MESIISATRWPAEFFGMEDSLGTIEEGKIADLVLLEASPLEYISHTQKIAAVLVGGKYYPKQTLARMLAEVESVASNIGRYNLVSAAGHSLPAIVSQNPSTGYKQEVTGGYIELRSDRTCTVSTEYRYTEGGRTSTSSSRNEGTYMTSGKTITFAPLIHWRVSEAILAAQFHSDQVRSLLQFGHCEREKDLRSGPAGKLFRGQPVFLRHAAADKIGEFSQD
jgi:hypothetical protein